MQKRKDNSGKRASRRKFLKQVTAIPMSRLAGGEALAAGKSPEPGQSPSAPAADRRQGNDLVYQHFEEDHVSNEPFEWLIPRRYMLYLRRKNDYGMQFINDKLEGPHTGTLFNADSRTFVGVANSRHVGMVWDDGTLRFEGVPGFAPWLFTREPLCTLRFLPDDSVVLNHQLVENYLPFVQMRWSYQLEGFNSAKPVMYQATVAAVTYGGRMLYIINLTGIPKSYRPATAEVDRETIPEDLAYTWALHLYGGDFKFGPGATLRGPAGVFGKCLGDFQQNGQMLTSQRLLSSPAQWIVISTESPLSEAEIAELDAGKVQSLVQAQKQEWEDFLARGTQYDLPLSFITDAYRASLIGMKIVEAKITRDGKTYYVTLPGATMYKKFWWRDCSLMHRSWDLAGYHEEAARSMKLATFSTLPSEVNLLSARANVYIEPDKIDSATGPICRYLLSQRPDGSWTAPPGQWDGTGLSLFGMASHYLLTRDSNWLADTMPAMEKGANFLLRARVGTPGFQEWVNEFWPAYAAVQKYAVPWDPGLLPGGGGEGGSDSAFRLPLRPHAGEKELEALARQTPLQSYNHDFFAILGLRTYARVLEETKKGDPAPYLKAIDEYTESLEDSIRKTQKKYDIYWIPAGPDGGMKMSLIGAVLYPGRVFPAHHPIVTGLFDYFVAQDKPDLAPRGFYGTHPDRWAFTQWFLIMGQLLRGEHKKAWRTFDVYLRCMWLPGSWRENMREPRSRFAQGDQPDLFNASLYVQMVRDFLLREEGEDVLIADGLHPLWLPPGKSLSVRNAPTDFGGRVSYTMRRSEDGLTLQLDVTNQGRSPRKFVWTPRGFGEISSARVNGMSYELSAESVELHGQESHVEIFFR